MQFSQLIEHFKQVSLNPSSKNPKLHSQLSDIFLFDPIGH
jgi:hypothetical protein